MSSMRDRVQNRLDTLRLNPFEAARRAGLERGFLNDLLAGRKKTVRGPGLTAIANALECDPEYLLGSQPTPRRGRRADAIDGIRVGGLIEDGVWRESRALAPLPATIPIEPDRRFTAEAQSAWIVRGPVEEFGFRDGDVLVAVELTAFQADRPVKEGDAVVVQMSREAATLRRRDRNAEVEVQTTVAPFGSFDAVGPVIVGVVIKSIRVFQ